MTILLSRSDVARLLDMAEVIDIMAKAFADFVEGRAVMPQRTVIGVPDNAGTALYMPAYLKGTGDLGVKVVTVYPGNPERHKLPTILGTIMLLDDQTGAPLALMDGGYLTAIRTGAVAGLATRLLARRDAAVHTAFGTGGMARAQVWAVNCVRDIQKLILYSIDPPEVRRAFRESLRDFVGAEVVLADDPARAVAEADIVTLVTSARTPVVDGSWFKPGTHINGIGSHAPRLRELDSLTVQRARIVCDHVDACRAEAGDLIIPAEAGEWNWDRACSLGDLVTGKIAAREDGTEITLFKSVGLAIQDLSTAGYVYRKALEHKAGTEFDFAK